MRLFNKQKPKIVDVKGNTLRCPICNNDHFYTKKAQLNTA